jgi:O-acetyl-ADP-ribose deacetylase (regulator of RNase III)
MKAPNNLDYADDIDLFEEFVPQTRRYAEMDLEEIVDTLLNTLKPVADRLGPIREDTYAEKRLRLRAALNILEPCHLQKESVDRLDRLLQAELRESPIVTASEIARQEGLEIEATRVTIFKADITTLEIDAVVNAANNRLLGCFQPLHDCIDNAIHSKAGTRLRDDCYRIMQRQKHPEPTGTAKITRAYNLPSKFIIHTVGPIVQGKLTERHENELTRSYRSCLEICKSVEQIRGIAFCCISTGVFGYPPKQAAKTAFRTVCNWLRSHPGALDTVVFNVFSEQDLEIYKAIAMEVTDDPRNDQ